ncbi:hypothetical protein HMN09_00843900 [Mycena chlorophos]|uniref:Uncharacterized protein n=1 Tax=Mycena chlorophos TaxID=658473 RepID=A0A8H6SSH1_MYCCL|nr:hypothetical protein HMN09_00843900 [Mycena chlorophos]
MTSVDAVALPPELERHIFELAAWGDMPMTLLLCRVARRVHIWIGPLRYRVIHLPGDIELDKLLRHLEEYPQAAQHVLHLAFQDQKGLPPGHVLSMFPNLVDLGMWCGSTTPADLPQVCMLQNLTHLSVSLKALLAERDVSGDNPDMATGSHGSDSELSLAGLTRLTHLELIGDVPHPLIPILKTLPRLTHLSFFDIYFPDIILEALDVFRDTLRLLVVVHQDEEELYVPQSPHNNAGATHPAEAQARSDDPRFVVLHLDCAGNFEEAWNKGAWDGQDYWRRAEETVASRVREQILRSS